MRGSRETRNPTVQRPGCGGASPRVWVGFLRVQPCAQWAVTVKGGKAPKALPALLPDTSPEEETKEGNWD